MALHLLSSDQIETSCRRRIESCELWLRRLVHDAFLPKFGTDYINLATYPPNGDHVFSAGTRKNAGMRWLNAPGRAPRAVDMLLFDDLGVAIGKVPVYEEFFRAALGPRISLGPEHVRQMMEALVPIRNKLSHANGVSLSMLEAERALCYCNDIISAIQAHYATISMSDQFPAPQFTRVSDSLGNVWHPASTRSRFASVQNLRSGDSIRFEVEVDSTFAPDEYDIAWTVNNIPRPETARGPVFSLTLTDRHVSVEFTVSASLVSKRSWHRHATFDDSTVLDYKVFPPL